MPYADPKDKSKQNETYYNRNREKIKARERARYAANKERFAARSRKWRANNKERSRTAAKRWQEKNKDKKIAIQRAERHRLKAQVIEAYGGKCACCSEDHVEFLSIDHINGRGNAHRKILGSSTLVYRELRQQGFPKEEFRLLCFNCNQSIGIWGYCPHEHEARR